MIELIIFEIGSFVAKSIAEKGVQLGFFSVFRKKQPQLERQLGKVISETIKDYSKKYPIIEKDKKLPFYKSKEVINELLQFRYFSDYNTEKLDDVINHNPKIIQPTTEQLNQFIQLLNNKIKENDTLRQLEIDENYKSKVYENSIKLTEILSELKELKNLTYMERNRNNLQRAKDLIANDKIEQAFDIIKKLCDSDRENTIILLLSKFNELKNAQLIGTLNIDEYRIEKTKITNSLLQLISEVEDKFGLVEIEKAQFINTVPTYNLDELIGRKDILDKIHNSLKSNNQLVLVNGLGGIGKTTLAKAYINSDYSAHYKHIAWVTVIDNIISSFLTDFTKKSDFYEYEPHYDEHTNFSKLIHILQKTEGNNLLIIDNANDPNEIVKYKEQLKATRWKILFTSRAIPDYTTIIRIDTLEPTECKELFLRYYQKEHEPNEIPQLMQDLDNLLKHINYHTLLTELLAKAGNKNKQLNISKINELIKSQDIKADKLQRTIVIGGNAEQKNFEQQDRLYSYIMTTFEFSNLNDVEMSYLRYFSILPSTEITDNDLKAFFQIAVDKENDFYETIDDLVSKGWLIQSGDKYKIHSLIQTVAKEKLNPTPENCKSLVAYFSQHTKYDRKESPVSKIPYTIYLESIIETFKNYEIEFIDWYRNLSAIYYDIYNIKKSLDNEIKNLDVLQKYFPMNYEDLVQSNNNISTSYLRLKNYELAHDYINKSFELHKYINTINNVHIGTSYSNRGHIYNRQGNFNSALIDSIKAIEIFEAVPNCEYLFLSFGYSRLAHDYLGLEQFNEALEAAKKSLYYRELEKDNLHPKLGGAYTTMARIYLKMKEFTQAEKYILKALDIWGKTLPQEHHDVISARKIYDEIKKSV